MTTHSQPLFQSIGGALSRGGALTDDDLARLADGTTSISAPVVRLARGSRIDNLIDTLFHDFR